MRLIISRRLERLDENERRGLAAAAVIGPSFSFQLLSAISEIDVDELFIVVEKAQRMGIIVSSAEGPERPLTFSHELVRQTLLAAISAPRRERMHASVADAIQRLNPEAVNERAGEIVDHFLKAGSFVDVPKLVRWLTQAGTNALYAAAFDDARRNFESALSHKGARDPREKADLLVNLAMAELGLERWDDALAHLRESLELYIDAGDRDVIGRSFSSLTDALIFAGRYAEANEVARRGLTYFAGEVSPWRVRLLDGLSQGLAWAEGYEPARAALDEALKLASQLADPALMGRMLGIGAVVDFHFYRLREAVDACQARLSGDLVASPWERALQMRILFPALLFLSRMDEVEWVAREIEPLARKIGQSFPIAVCVMLIERGSNSEREPNLQKLDESPTST